MKWDSSPSSIGRRREAVVFSERLRTIIGWPVPEQRTVVTEDCLFVLQQFMPGTVPELLGHEVIDRILHLHQGRLGLGRPEDPSSWPGDLIRTLTVGGEGYCLHESLRGYDRRTASLVARIEEFGHDLAEEELDGHDIVHWDLHPGNLLQNGGSLSAIVDTDFAKVGDAAFDLVTLALTSLTLPCESGVRSRLFAAAFADLDDRKRLAYTSHLFVRFLDWPIRRGSTEEIEFWLSHVDQMLDF
jgi:hypothetical protein